MLWKFRNEGDPIPNTPDAYLWKDEVVLSLNGATEAAKRRQGSSLGCESCPPVSWS